MDLEKFRLIGDPPADAVVEVIQRDMPELWASDKWKNFSRNNQKPDDTWPKELIRFINQNEVLPEDSLPKRLKRTQEFFSKHQPLILLCLGLYSLPYCYAAANGAKVLYHSKRLREAPGKRLTETASFVLDVSEPGAFDANGKGLRSILKVRLMHALTRSYIKNQPFWQNDWGLPINQEDMAGTNLAFSLIVLRGLRKLGVDVKGAESKDFLQYWNLIGHLLGIEKELLKGNVKEALLLEKHIAKRHFVSSNEGIELTASLRKHIENEMRNSAIHLPVSALMAYLLGSEISKMLDIETTPFDKVVAKSFVSLSKIQLLIGRDFQWQRQKIDRVNL
ncbi:oxygenase MpaB family protein [uncultured Imperialibacter sp.]|uniref:oxygenase MpaB family protein n=1 Tax=uncultured Imperialibacter sp. TaxID=1672639 RepID=UPI0030D98B0F|tara:strand:+ start:58783 stop:59787 length:1005 start_codon:yes stop_codon:yes gene_type:complete